MIPTDPEAKKDILLESETYKTLNPNIEIRNKPEYQMLK